MKFPKFWARGEAGNFLVWRLSDASVEEAKRNAEEAAQSLAARFTDDNMPDQRYGYDTRPMREPVLREMRDASGELVHAVTRNSYGCQVLNSAEALFVDVDFPEAELHGILSLFSRKKAEDPAKAPMALAAAWAAQHPGWNWRVYRTKAGLRLLATHALFDPADPECERVFQAMGADPLYRKLCQTQTCFRARLTPKHWRCQPKVGAPPTRWPFADAREEAAFAAWEAKYRAASHLKATCQLLDAGSGEVHPQLQEMVALHDEMTKAESTGLELA